MRKRRGILGEYLMNTYSIAYNNINETWEAFQCDESVPEANDIGLNTVVIDITHDTRRDYFVYVKCQTIQGAFSEGSILIESAWPL
jgi:hypothetical protein